MTRNANRPNFMEELIERAARELRMPAGDSERFSSPESVLRHHSEFVLQCHTTWKRWHQEAVQQLFIHEGVLLREKTHPLGHGVAQLAEYQRAVWRRVNDTIIWSLFGGERHKVKRLCLYRKRTNLLECNPDSAMSAVAEINAEPMSIALWNDTTSCVDIGDLTVIRNGLNPVPEFIELKEGTVNEEIGSILAVEGEAKEAAIKAFQEKFGKKGMAQLDRVLRQQLIGDQALNLLVHEKGIDPMSGQEIEVTDSGVEPRTYDDVLASVLQTSLSDRKATTDCIDGCLWIHANAAAKPGKHYPALFLETLANQIPGFSPSSFASHPQWDADKLCNLGWGINYPVARPLLLRDLPTTQVASVTFGALRNNVWLYLDWNAFARLIQKAGGEISWGSRREIGKARAMHQSLRPPIVGGRLMKIHVDGAIGYISGPNLVEMFFDGVTPWTMAQIAVHQLRDIVARHGSPK